MSLDPDIAKVLELVEQSGLPPLETLSPAEARAQYETTAPRLDLAPAPMEAVSEIAVGRESRFVRTRLYTPKGISSPAPLLVWFHGGGWTIGSLATADRVCRHLATEARIRVLSVGYALGPEHPFPAAIEDALIVYRAIAGAPGDYGIDPARIAVGGDSAGGNLAAVLTQEQRGSDLPYPALQLLIYPSVDMAGDYASRRELAEGYLLTAALTDWFGANYAPDRSLWPDPRISPLRHRDFSGLPPAHIQTAGFDPLKDEGAAYAMTLADAGVAVDHRHAPGLIHGYFTMGGFVPAAKDAVDAAADALRHAFHDG